MHGIFSRQRELDPGMQPLFPRVVSSEIPPGLEKWPRSRGTDEVSAVSGERARQCAGLSEKGGQEPQLQLHPAPVHVE